MRFLLCFMLFFSFSSSSLTAQISASASNLLRSEDPSALISLIESRLSDEVPEQTDLAARQLAELKEFELILLAAISQYKSNLSYLREFEIDADETVRALREILISTCSNNTPVLTKVNEFVFEIDDIYSKIRNRGDSEADAIINEYVPMNGEFRSRVNSVPGGCTKLSTDFARVIEIVRTDLDDFESQGRDRVEQMSSNILAIEGILGSLRERIASLTTAVSTATTREFLDRTVYLLVAVIGAFGVISIAVIRLFPDFIVMEWVASGQVIQFVTVTVLLSVIMALGLSGILNENTLGTLLGGIGGYVLSQGVGRTAAYRAKQEVESANISFDKELKRLDEVFAQSGVSDDAKRKFAELRELAVKENTAGNTSAALGALDEARRLLS